MDQNLPSRDTFKCKDKRNLKTPVLACTYTHKGEFIVAGCQDGSIQVWDQRANALHRPQIRISEAHSEDITFLKAFRDPNQLASRSLYTDAEASCASLKIWDIRKASKPLFSFEDKTLFNLCPQANVALSANERVILTGSSALPKKGEFSYLHAYDLVSGELILRDRVLEAGEGINVVNWVNQNRMNQIYLGSSLGNIKVLYNPSKTNDTVGVLKCMKKESRRRANVD
mmetsp:Transcript_8622/g.14579  ORF Transcript_8622/g.14579 Transcript_8622/m.14579 type:complete len:228 (-) Transcript_8622:581-1264(-)